MSWWGLIGAPIATVLTTTFMRYVCLLSITHYLKLNIAQVFPWKSLLHSFISAAIASIPLIFLIQLDINVWLNLLLMAIVYGVIYLMLLKRSLALLLEEREAVRAILPSKFSWVI